ncbi:similar to 20S cyclosome subunit (APC1/BimE) [Plenodomus lingam JN3]|uniref:Similar to 20S cyclosome subunit (APC1/BimE) n=1 Tax=Leptosphaeria maculans (strain JN3 / isolate v23.1.3 / race Av1-4-5-6-7-8) TaxID=985895 RepID=E5A3B2_LEPMJ|nr:similar to 20S cyclosome subunit (APC1/BimE) [Plenodomus lingam JN3]CBX98125.1 similar to 20S cyclosome subunit (APC1/BimE) [Plenodomus lingam JN3]
MAFLRSIGVHKPAGLQYLVHESILGHESSERDYTWQAFTTAEATDSDSPIDELVTTDYHVVWSRGGVIRKVFSFEVDKEKVIQALLTWFPVEEASHAAAATAATTTEAAAGVAAEHHGQDLSKSFLTQGTQPATDPNAPVDTTPPTIEVRSRALVVFLRSQAHVFFLSGATHIVNLPFEVDKAFPAARGLVVQRKLASPRTAAASSPSIPSAPPNSFLTANQSFLSQSFSQSFSPTLHRHAGSLGGSRPGKSRLSGPATFLDDMINPVTALNQETIPRLYSFTDPLSELGLVVNVIAGGERAGLLTTNGSSHRKLEAMDKAEEVVYVSPQNEVLFDRSGNDKPLLLVITANPETNVFTIWSAAYLEPKSISTSRKQHAHVPMNKHRRRSSHGATAPGTGATTPASRGADRLRESFGGAPRSKTQPPSLKQATQSQERLSDQAVEDALASQLNPDSDMARQPKESRRVSSLLSRAELSTSFDKSAFQDMATSRNSLGGSFSTSFGASQRSRRSMGHDRTSLGGAFSHSRHRASTPGSITSRMSLGAASIDDPLEDTMDEDTFDTIEDHDELDDLFAPPDGTAEPRPGDGLHKELVTSVIAEIPVTQYLRHGLFTLSNPSNPEDQPQCKIVALNAPFNSATLHERKLYLYISHSSLQEPLEIELAVTRKRLSPSASATQSKSSIVAPRYACVPRYVGIRRLEGARDLVKLRDGCVERVALLTSTEPHEPCLSLTAGWGSHLPMKISLGPIRLFDPYAILQDNQTRATAGSKRTILATKPLRHVVSLGAKGKFELIDGEYRRHRFEVRLSPEDRMVAELFRVLCTVLPSYTGDFLLEIWWNIRKLLSTENQESQSRDWYAFVATVLSLAVPFVDEKMGKSSNRTRRNNRRSSGRPSSQAKPDELIDDEDSAWHLMCTRQNSQSHMKSWQTSPWAWALHSNPSTSAMSPPARRSSSNHHMPVIAQQIKSKDEMLLTCMEIARQYVRSPIGKATNDCWRRLSPSEKQDLRISSLSEIVVCLHLFREERKLDTMCHNFAGTQTGNLAPLLAQIGHWLRWDAWDWRQGGFFDLDGGSANDWAYEESNFTSKVRLHSQPWDTPPSIMLWLGTVVGPRRYAPFPTLAMLIRKSKASPHSSINIDEIIAGVTPRTIALHTFFRDIDPNSSPQRVVELIKSCDITPDVLSTLPEVAKAPLMEAITRCQANPPTTWSSSLLRLIEREELDLSHTPSGEFLHDCHLILTAGNLHPLAITRDVHTICQSADRPEPVQSTAEVDRHYITRLIFREDRRFMEAYALMEPLKQTVAEYRADSRGDDAAMLEGQKALMQWVMVRTFSLPIGSSMIKFSSKKPLLTEKYPLYGFSTSCLMKPMGNVVTAERHSFSEEKYFWAFFNAGVAAGLSISRDAQGIDTSWIMYNKPSELTNKHAGLLLGLGLNGHLRTIAKWLSFKYLTPKHTMTSVGLLLGLSASFMGTMDTLVTRLLSVHVTRMLPQGAAELNLSPYTQTTGLMGIGLLYYNTQHRRMSEVMLSEIEHVDVPDPSEPPDTLRDEAYRLAAGFALGFINLGKGKDLRGLHDMRIVERLMKVAVAPKPVDIVHILDQATAGAVIAVALIFMKTHDQSVARKIDIPDTLPQFDYVRPDIFLLRIMAKHIIMWDGIEANDTWVINSLPVEYRVFYDLKQIDKLRSEQMPFFNIVTGLLWSVSLKHAGTGDKQVRDFLLKYLDQLIRINKLPALRWDSRLCRNTVRNCQDLVALAAATVMAGTGDLDVFRRLRGLHGRVGPEAPYGSHLAAHMAFGALFIAGGTQTFSRSNKAIASLICAFYPIFPSDVQDSKAHLQAFRYFWVLAAEPRCLVVRDVDTGRAISMPIVVHLKDGSTSSTSSTNTHSKTLVAPCLLPELHLVKRIETADQTYWPTTLDFVYNALHLKSFERNQTLYVRRRSAHDTYATAFSATLVALNEAQSVRTSQLLFHWIFTLPALTPYISPSDKGVVLPVDQHSRSWLDPGATVVESRLVLGRLSHSWKVEELRELRGVFEWAERAGRADGRLRWLGREVVERLKAGVSDRGRRVAV